MRKIKEIIIHCSATREGRDYTVADIDRWHRERGFFCIGYHFVIYRDGSIHVGRSVEEVGAHCKGHNTVSIGVLQTFTPFITNVPSTPQREKRRR